MGVYLFSVALFLIFALKVALFLIFAHLAFLSLQMAPRLLLMAPRLLLLLICPSTCQGLPTWPTKCFLHSLSGNSRTSLSAPSYARKLAQTTGAHCCNAAIAAAVAPAFAIFAVLYCYCRCC
jgi:hypothetical protein